MGFLNRRVSKAWVLAALLGSGLSVPAIAQSLNELACAAAVFCAPKITAEDAQVVFNLTEAQAQTAFIEASIAALVLRTLKLGTLLRSPRWE